MAAQLKVKRGPSGNLSSLPVVDGQLLFTTDTKKIYLDNGTTRLQVGGGTVTTGSANGTIAIDGVDVAVKGLGARAFDSTSYLPLSGGTLTASSGVGTILVLKSGANATYLKFVDKNNAILGWFGFSKQDNPVISYGSTSTDYSILHSGNYSSYCAPASHTHAYIQGGNGQLDIGINNRPIMSTYYADTGNRSWGIEKYSSSSLSWHDYNDSTGEYLTTRTLLDASNYTTYTVTKTGSGASGTWPISVSGNAYSVRDSGDGRTLTFNYSADGLSSVSWLAGWNGAELRAVSPSVVTAGAAKKLTDSSCGDLTWLGDHLLQSGSRPNASLHFGTSTLYQFRDNSYYILLDSGNYTTYVPTKNGTGASGTWGINITGSSASCTGNSATATTLSSTLAINKGGTGATTKHQAFHNLVFQGAVTNANTCMKRGLYTYVTTATNTPESTSYGGIETIICNDMAEGVAIGGPTSSSWVWQWGYCTNRVNPYIRNSINAGAFSTWRKVWLEGDSITGAVWNDYAEYRESTTTKPGLVVFENGDDTLSPTTERLSHFAGIVSDTWGFCQGETEKAKTPIAVAGRVLAYTYQERSNYKPGDCVCAAPNGTVDIMTREEVMMYPDRIVGTVSCIPDYEEWGQGDRPAVKVDGRIWIKVR